MNTEEKKSAKPKANPSTQVLIGMVEVLEAVRTGDINADLIKEFIRASNFNKDNSYSPKEITRSVSDEKARKYHTETITRAYDILYRYLWPDSHSAGNPDNWLQDNLNDNVRITTGKIMDGIRFSIPQKKGGKTTPRYWSRAFRGYFLLLMVSASESDNSRFYLGTCLHCHKFFKKIREDAAYCSKACMYDVFRTTKKK